MFELDARLAAGSIKITDWPLCEVRLKHHPLFHWMILIPRRAGLVEMHDVSVADQPSLIDEINQLSRFMKSYFKADKMNVGALGNIVSQLHIHVVARHRDDPAWPYSIWQANFAEGDSAFVIDEKEIAELRKCFSFSPHPGPLPLL